MTVRIKLGLGKLVVYDYGALSRIGDAQFSKVEINETADPSRQEALSRECSQRTRTSLIVSFLQRDMTGTDM
jgi:hypothetical protein